MNHPQTTFQNLKNQYLDRLFQFVLFAESGEILQSDHTMQDFRPYIGKSVYQINDFLFSIREVIESLSPENPKIDFPRMEIPMGSREGVFDYTIERIEIQDQVCYFWGIQDNTRNNQYLSTVQQERNEVAIKLELEELKEENVKLNERVEQRTAEIRKQHELINKQSQNILKSIQYAKRIQEALLPAQGNIPQFPYEHFVFYIARDIVCGDFYWYKDLGNGQYLIAVADCTGHGVPGAFMTVLGISILNQIIEESPKLPSPKQILETLDRKVLLNLKTKTAISQESINDGMDIALCLFDTRHKQLTFAGAKRPLYRVSAGQIHEIKGSPYPIGSNQFKKKQFHQQAVSYQSGDMIYIGTDGYADQFGGPEDRKFMTANLKKLLVSIAEMEAHQQNQILKQVIEDWKDGYKQTDDILWMGIKLEK